METYCVCGGGGSDVAALNLHCPCWKACGLLLSPPFWPQEYKMTAANTLLAEILTRIHLIVHIGHYSSRRRSQLQISSHAIFHFRFVGRLLHHSWPALDPPALGCTRAVGWDAREPHHCGSNQGEQCLVGFCLGYLCMENLACIVSPWGEVLGSWVSVGISVIL